MNSDEISKFQSEYLRHLNTLSTGSIVLTAAFLEKILKNPEWKCLVAISLVAFMISILGAVITYTMDVLWPGEAGKGAPKWAKNLAAISMLLAWIGFLIGIFSLGSFAVKNLPL